MRFEVLLFAGEQVASLARFGILQSRKGFLESAYYNVLANQIGVSFDRRSSYKEDRNQAGYHDRPSGRDDSAKFTSLRHLSFPALLL